MRTARIACAMVLLGCSALALAHAKLVKSDPAEGTTVKAAPTKFVLTFGEPAKLTTLTLQKDASPRRRLLRCRRRHRLRYLFLRPSCNQVNTCLPGEPSAVTVTCCLAR